MATGASYHCIIKNQNFNILCSDYHMICQGAVARDVWIPNLIKDIHSGDVKETVNVYMHLKTASLTLNICCDLTYRPQCRSKGLRWPLYRAVINTCLENLEPEASLKNTQLSQQSSV